MSQLDLFTGHRSSASISEIPDPAEIRVRMESILAELTDAASAPWSNKKMRLWQLIWPQMMRWLPESEHMDLQSRFDDLIGRFAEN